MGLRESGSATAVAAIAAIALIICFGIQHGIDHTLTTLGIVAIAGLAGFSARGMIIPK